MSDQLVVVFNAKELFYLISKFSKTEGDFFEVSMDRIFDAKDGEPCFSNDLIAVFESSKKEISDEEDDFVVLDGDIVDKE